MLAKQEGGVNAEYQDPRKRFSLRKSLHVGAFTSQGTFKATIPHLEDLRALGIIAFELMPLAQFPGELNWGYDGVYPFAVQNSMEAAQRLKQLVIAPSEGVRCGVQPSWTRRELPRAFCALLYGPLPNPLGCGLCISMFTMAR